MRTATTDVPNTQEKTLTLKDTSFLRDKTKITKADQFYTTTSSKELEISAT